MSQKTGYSKSTTDYYMEYYQLAEDDERNIKEKVFSKVANNFSGTDPIDILLLGVGAGRLEIPLLESFPKSQQINVTAVDASKDMLRNFENVLTAKKLSNVSATTYCKDIRKARSIFKAKYDIITSFFVLHMVEQWVNILKNITSSLKQDGFFLTAEETGIVTIIDGLLPNKDVCDYTSIDKDYYNLWSRFHAERINLGKIWYQPIVASDYSLLTDILETLEFRLDTVNINLSSSKAFSMEDFKAWLYGEHLFMPIGRYLTPDERNTILANIEAHTRFGPKKIPRLEGHKFLTFKKVFDQSADQMANASIQSIKTFVNKTSNNVLIDRNIRIGGKEGLFKEMMPPYFESDKYMVAIKNRLFVVGITMLSCFHKKLHFDYVIWKPDYYLTEKSTYKHGLPSFIVLESKDIFNHYIATYSLYFFIRSKLVPNSTFIDFIFHNFRYFTQIVIKSGKSIDTKIDIRPDRTIVLTITLPPIDESSENYRGVKALLRTLSEAVAEDNKFNSKEYLFNFDNISDFVQRNSTPAWQKEISRLSEALSDDFKNKYHDSFKTTFNAELEKLVYLFDVPKATDNDVSELFKSLFCFNLIGIGRTETEWRKIRFYLGFIFGKEAEYEGFNILTSIDFYKDDVIDSVINIPSKIWSSKDGLYISLQLVKEYVYKHALQSAIAAIMARNMSHNIGSHVIFYSASANHDYHTDQHKTFLRYLQERMEFLSLVSTTEASWGVKYGLKSLIEHFESQTILLDNIVKSEGIDNNEVKIKINPTPKLSKMPDILIPHGEAGKQAIYTILENFIRNTAKHQWSMLDKKPEQFQINLLCEEIEELPLMYKITISSNVAGCNHELIDRLNKKLSEKILDDKCQLKQTNRGLKEQRISACFLRLLPVIKIEEYTPDNKTKLTGEFSKPLVKAVCTKKHGSGSSNHHTCDLDDCSFGFEFYVLKPMELLWIGEHDFTGDEIRSLKDKGILVYKSVEEAENDFPKTFPSKMVLLSSEYTEEWLQDNSNLRRMPYRILILDGNVAANSKWVPIESSALPNLTNGNINKYVDELLVFLWSNWVKGFFKNSFQPVGIKHNRYKSQLSEPFVFHDCVSSTNCESEYILSHGSTDKPHGFSISYSSGESLATLIHSSIYNDHYLQWEIAEMVHIRILIVDERVYDSKDIPKGEETIGETWARQGVDIVDDLLVITKPDDLKEMLKKKRYTFLIIHQGVIDKIIEKHKDAPGFVFDKWWGDIQDQDKVAFTVIDSGRGEPEMVKDGKGRWLQLSDLEHHIVECCGQSDAKYNLIQVLYALREGRK